MTPPNNPFESFTWLSQFIEAVPNIVAGNHNGFGCESFVTPNPNGVARRGNATGNSTNGIYWLGFYYKLWSAEKTNNKALPWFGCSFVDEFTICIIVEAINAQDAKANNVGLHKYLLNREYSGGIHGSAQKPFGRQINKKPEEGLWYRFDDYMTIVKCESNFSLSDWICSGRNQAGDLREFFETVNANHLAPNI
jgi:hypothetical protein